MNQMVPADRVTAIEQKINQQVSSAIAVGTGGISFQNAGEVMEYAKMMAVSGSAVPKHLRGQPGACLGIIDDAIRFQTSPYALARKSYFVNDNLAYEAQVLAGIVNAHAPLKQRPQVAYEGEGNDRVCIVTGQFKDGAVRDYRSPRLGSITPKNSPLWKNDPDQQLAYYSLRGFARRHCPEILLGIYDVEEMRSIDHAEDEPRPSLADRLASARAASSEPAGAREGFDPAHVARETESLSTGQEIDHEPGSGEPSPPQPSEPVTSASGQEPQPLPDGVSNPAEQPVGAGAEGQEQSAPAPAPDEFTAEEWKWLRQGTRMLWAATEKGYQETVDNQARAIAAETADEIGRAVRDKLSAIRKQCKLVCFGEMEHATGRKLVAALAGVTEDELREVEP